MKNTGQEGIQTKVLKELQLLTPLRAEFIPEETDSYYLTDGNYLDGADLVQYKGAISRKIREETSEDKGTLNLMDYFYGSDSIKQKIESIEISVKQVDHSKSSPAVLRGAMTANGTYSYEQPVTYWMPFNGGIGFHDADWQPYFGGDRYLTGGSHGCINLPPENAGQLYSLIQYDVPIVCFY